MADLDALRLLAAVGETGSLTAAGRRLGVTQQAASARLRALETEIGAVLVARGARGSVLTAVGELVAGWGGDVVAAAARFDESVAALQERRRGTLRIAASLTIAEYLLPDWLSQWRRRDPAAAGVRLDAENSTAVIARVRRGGAELGFIETPDLPDDLDRVVIARDELVVVAAPSHPWASAARITRAELAATPLVLRERGSGTRRALDAALEEGGTPLVAAPAAELPSSLAVRTTAATGFAPAVVSALVVRDDLAAGRVVRVALEGPPLTRPLSAVWARGRAVPAASRLLEAIAELVGADV
ncbi:molybdate transport repressor ModE-like protein [Microbacterium sp. AG790]|uniref:LysR family transcriptional regulator n=1 Tax=Microbacterium sp. AG790 TaxID=2183995 RepID=UPI000EAE37B4|nr:LysR family transcriptional regulator [Microbacterium sp. AG790]RKS93021.1 molybdate transport repressor ModE-like protein [Microbacterium sp. AG790]